MKSVESSTVDCGIVYCGAGNVLLKSAGSSTEECGLICCGVWNHLLWSVESSTAECRITWDMGSIPKLTLHILRTDYQLNVVGGVCGHTRFDTTVFTIIECLAERLEDNVVHLDLRNGVVRGFSNHISFIHKPTTRPGRSCDKQVVLKLDFSGPYKEAKILLDYAEPPRLWTLDISDSPTGDGYGGDNGSTSNMAETQIHNKQFRIYGNNLPGHMDASANGGLLITTVDNFIRRGSTAKISISDERVEWKSGPHKDNIKSRFLYTLRGQQPLYGTVDYNVYVGLNRVVAGNFRSGSGLCSATIALQSSGK
ncbi:hypothetical protein KP79_PYT26173 [Mizuhopecten yessoensis]|uniref:Uncharacterized protein n=1 Tax=Mizuhopecten yessoensis TaxID=6573 RepID=A0A210R4R9_MIZYE|nr:hypothetical protein KP79_PYT26173 [Mizuhopecten yessoensis]